VEGDVENGLAFKVTRLTWVAVALHQAVGIEPRAVSRSVGIS
jgi:hypothetical protein